MGGPNARGVYHSQGKRRRCVPRIISSQSPIVFSQMRFIDWLKIILGTERRGLVLHSQLVVTSFC